MTRVARHVRITGRVQGVFFRAWTHQQAEQLDVHGWIRNCPDGSVEAHLEGQQGSVDQLIQLLRRGPSGSWVEDVDISDAKVENADWFAVRH